MGLAKVTGESKYLDMRKVALHKETECLAYLISANPGYSEKMTNGFAVFYFRDVNGLLVTGRTFKPEWATVLGHVLSGVRQKAVKVKYTANANLGYVTLTVDSVEVYEGSDFDYSLFLSKVPNVDILHFSANEILRKYDVSALPAKFITDTDMFVCNGAVGGMAKLSSMVITNCHGFEDTPGVEMKELMSMTQKALTIYSIYSEAKSRIDVPVQGTLLHHIQGQCQTGDVSEDNITANILMAVVGMGKPAHLYAHIICDAIEAAVKNLKRSYDYPLIVKGSTKYESGVALSRY